VVVVLARAVNSARSIASSASSINRSCPAGAGRLPPGCPGPAPRSDGGPGAAVAPGRTPREPDSGLLSGQAAVDAIPPEPPAARLTMRSRQRWSMRCASLGRYESNRYRCYGCRAGVDLRGRCCRPYGQRSAEPMRRSPAAVSSSSRGSSLRTPGSVPMRPVAVPRSGQWTVHRTRPLCRCEYVSGGMRRGVRCSEHSLHVLSGPHEGGAVVMSAWP
jgi:hypothetical protein